MANVSIDKIIIAKPDFKPDIDNNLCSFSVSDLDAWHYGASY